MTDHTPPSGLDTSGVVEEPLLDALLREAVPEIKLALGDLIDRDNQRALPGRYARLIQSTLVVTLRADAAAAVQPVAAELERELTDSCMRHGLLYDREYRVRLREAGQKGAPLFRVSVGKEGEPEAPLAEKPLPEPVPAPAAAAEEATVAVPERAPEPPQAPSVDPDATRLDFAAPPAGATGFPAGRFELGVEDEDGTEREHFVLPGPAVTVGRATDRSELQSDIQLTGQNHVSRRQLAVVWAPEGDEEGFTVYNLGLNAVHVGEREVPGANLKGDLRLDEVAVSHTVRLLPGEAVRIGQHGPVLRLRKIERFEGAEFPHDPDATQFG